MGTRDRRTDAFLPQTTCFSPCALCEVLSSHGSFDDFRQVLYRFIWRRFSSDDQTKEEDNERPSVFKNNDRHNSLTWMLCSAVFAGCPATVTWCVMSARNKWSCNATEKFSYEKRLSMSGNQAIDVELCTTTKVSYQPENERKRDITQIGCASSENSINAIISRSSNEVHLSKSSKSQIEKFISNKRSKSDTSILQVVSVQQAEENNMNLHESDVKAELKCLIGENCRQDSFPDEIFLNPEREPYDGEQEGESNPNKKRDSILPPTQNVTKITIEKLSYPEKTNEDIVASVSNWAGLQNKRTVCEFPLTDSWFPNSINLFVPPLHLACWRLDHQMIQLLLTNGADPNLLALEEVKRDTVETDKFKVEGTPANEDENSDFSLESSQDHIFVEGKLYHKSRGLSPLHFLALGIRSAPIYSVEEGAKARVVKKFSTLQDIEGTTRSEWMQDTLSTYSDLMSLTWESPSLKAGDNDKLMQIRIIFCLEALIAHGAHLNKGCSVHLHSLFPLDFVLQPPLKVYYAPSMARANQDSRAFRLHNLNHNASFVNLTCHIMLCHGATLSSHFLLYHRWRPAHLDCLHFYDVNLAKHFVFNLFRLGIFYVGTSGKQASREQNILEHNCFEGERLSLFISDIFNTPINHEVLSLIFHWLPLHILGSLLRYIEEKSSSSTASDESKMVWLVRELTEAQNRTLAHSSALVILQNICFNSTAVKDLPLPVPMKRNLTDLCFWN